MIKLEKVMLINGKDFSIKIGITICRRPFQVNALFKALKTMDDIELLA